MVFFIILGILIGALSIIFALQNIAVVTVTFFSYSLTGSLAVIIFMTLIVGMLVMIFLLLPSFISAEIRLNKMKKLNRALEDELAATKERIHESATGPQVVESNMVSLE